MHPSSSQVTPKWSKEISRFLGVKPQFVLWGNIHDQYPLETESGLALFNMSNYLRYYLRGEGYDFTVCFEPAAGFVLLKDTEQEANAKNEILLGEITGCPWKADAPFQPKDLAEAAEIIEKIVEYKNFENPVNGHITVNFASHLKEIPLDGQEEFFFRMYRLSRTCSPVFNDSAQRKSKYNLLIWLLDKMNDLPPWYALDNPNVRVLPISKPDNLLRRYIIDHMKDKISGYEGIEPEKQEQNVSMFTDQTSDLFASEIKSIIRIADEDGIEFLQITDAIRQYKLGITENPWSRLPKEKIRNARDELSKKVMGQEHAVAHASDILRRSFFNLSGAQYSRNSQRPKGVLFCAGPTGVGKTELAKAITELLFGSVTSYIRFDMSEFGHEHADQRLLGAPPGYVGYDTGGELINAIKQNPFSVILFDEIEKAHQKILDIFLQILDDGRLTSGAGETAYFSESLIVFTSNLGVYKRVGLNTELNVSANDDPKEVRKKIEESIREYFVEIKRPELLNRIGDNIVVFDFIKAEIAERIFEKMLRNITGQLEDDHKIKLILTDEAKSKLARLATEDLSMGGRGVGNALERMFINPLSRELFDANAASGDSYTMSDLTETSMGWKPVLKKS